MKSNYKNLIAYASSFASFVLPKIEVDEIILFGSTARGETATESDVDLFFNLKNREKETKKILKEQLAKFYNSSIYENFSLNGIKNPISIEVGNLDKWKLKRSIISEGIILYGKYKQIPENIKGYVLFTLKPIKDITKRNRIIRKLFGRKEKNYNSEGLINEVNGRQLSPSSFIISLEKTNEIMDALKSEKIDYTLIEFWSDKKF